MGSRRAVLQHLTVQPSTHAGLWLDRYLAHQTGDPRDGAAAAVMNGAKAALIREVTSRGAPDGYAAAFSRWRSLLERDESITLALARSQGRTVIGLGDKGSAEVGITLNHTWGVPILPGSALKGLASTTAHRLMADEAWRRGGESHRELFGSTDEQGLVHFLDAWWLPDGPPLAHDVMTSHHQSYYTRENNPPPPSDADSPNPVAFVSTTGTFLVAVQAWSQEWQQAALELLRIGLAELGIGGKTNAGYGRMSLELLLGGAVLPEDPPEASPENRQVTPQDDRLVTTPEERQAMRDALRHGSQHTLLEEWRAEGGEREEVRRALAAGMYRPSKRFRKNYPALVAWLRGV